MPIEIKACDGNIGAIIESQGKLTDKNLIDSLQWHLTQNKEKFQKYKYILIDHTALTKLAISDETVENISELLSDISGINSDAIVAMVTYVSYGASRDLIDKISKLHELFIYRSSWETLLFRTKPQAVRWIKERIRDKFGINGLTFD